MQSWNDKVFAVCVRCYYYTSVYLGGESVSVIRQARPSSPPQAYCCSTFGNDTASLSAKNHPTSHMCLLKECSHSTNHGYEIPISSRLGGLNWRNYNHGIPNACINFSRSHKSSMSYKAFYYAGQHIWYLDS
ncbi:uncharacterized protein LOC105686300 isoform X2 [Athalia rosae]|uniref:uncharacterized protein LOC105686300 isoform X1 n=1 Tax=Athalia rosae TaxID=37344 RepID=UPI0020334D21|nr:uncharacterized protein LOC105686300 isoform X1 [Athalia rosae]XP_048515206.1 uncharacterized protein LOC105686300 isoform X2 [Athalia rosae]XP_048515207.1 uncharacterized protein LOC105686300 isoform X2 [Athalia rosae]XP_048515208.1 uncharacterized protein LOC105686300 isoform X2 [Athalia rosae]